MPVQSFDTTLWDQLTTHVESASALVERVQQIQEQSRALLAAERAILAELRQARDAATHDTNAHIATFTREHTDAEKSLVIDTRNNLAAALSSLVTQLETAATHEALFAESARVNLDVPARYLKVAHDRLATHQAAQAAQAAQQ